MDDHIDQIGHRGNFAPGNAGVLFWTDVLLPVIGFVFLWLQRRTEREGTSPAPQAGRCGRCGAKFLQWSVRVGLRHRALAVEI